MKTIVKDLTVPEVYLPMFKDDAPENIIMWGGRGGGKSYAAAYKVVSFCMGKPSDCTFFVGRLYADDIPQSVFKQIRIAMNDMGVKAQEISKDRIKLKGGCEIRFSSFKDELNMRSSPRTIGLYYEESQQAENIVTLMNLRATARRVPGCFLFITSMNRLKPNDAMWELFKRIPDSDKLEIYSCVEDNPFASGSVMVEYEQAKQQLARGDMTEDEFNLVWRGLPNMDGEKSFYKYSFLEASNDKGDGVLNDEENYYKKYRTDNCEYDAMYLIKANAPINTEAHANVQSQLASGRVKLLIDERVAKVKLMGTRRG